ncbi:MAG: prolipoprotein diacylglyceryl transferase [Prevotellaceae bacterium]|jgi:prolipoprotein diacylglyceryl transferase|nr:prolipoprotein diacylglyceryl transferase [Prevotellaceae bacterium]
MTCIIWNIPQNIQIGSFSIHLYGLFFALGLLFGGLTVYELIKNLKVKQNYFIYAFVGILFGARFAHCLFYEPEYYFVHPLEIFLPFVIENGKPVFKGFYGLASHGGVAGLMIALWLFARRNKVLTLQIYDIFAIALPLAGGFIRLGNLMNSEIIGTPTNLPWAFVFPSIDAIPRHPAQLYEAIWYFLLFVVMFVLYKKIGFKHQFGFYTGIGLIGIAVFRFFIEFIKENQANFESSLPLNMGQLLSIPFVIAGVILVFNEQ